MMPHTELPPSTLEAGLLSSINSVDRLAEVQAAGITKEDFFAWHGVYNFICEYTAQYAGVPSPEIIKNKWEEWAPVPGAFDYWLKEFIKHAVSIKAEKIIHEARTEIATHPDTAIPELAAKLAGLQYAGNSHIVATDATIADRLEKYKTRKEIFEESGGNFLHGIPTGFTVIDNTHQGWMPGELVGFYARPGVGKTWLLVREAATAWAAGYRVLLISPEVSARHVALRVDVFLGHFTGVPLSHVAIFNGDPSQLAAYEVLVQKLAGSERWWTVDSLQGRPLGLKDIRALAKQLQPDMICIDGVMLLHDDDRAKEGWQKMENICYGLKNFATANDIVVMMSHQSVNTQKGRKHADGAQGRGDDWVMPTLNDAAGGEGFTRACTTILTMAPDQTHNNLRWYSIRKSRERPFGEWKPRYALGWDVDKGNIEDLSKYGEDLLVIEKFLEKM